MTNKPPSIPYLIGYFLGHMAFLFVVALVIASVVLIAGVIF